LSAELTSVPLAEHHEVAGFDCGVESLNEWLGQHALSRPARGDGANFPVGLARGAAAGLGVSLAPTEAARETLSRGQSSGYSTVPGYLLARLAVHIDLRGQG
jgi:hypothetical protein